MFSFFACNSEEDVIRSAYKQSVKQCTCYAGQNVVSKARFKLSKTGQRYETSRSRDMKLKKKNQDGASNIVT